MNSVMRARSRRMAYGTTRNAISAVREPSADVTRNSIKRQIYTLSQTIEPPLPVAAHVVRLRAGFDRKQFESATSDALKRAVRAELQELFSRAAP